MAQQVAPTEASWASAIDASKMHLKVVASLDKDYSCMLGDMRAVFSKGKTKNVEWRRAQLEQIHKMIADNHEEITAAVRADLGGSKLRGVGELSAAGDADFALANLDSWAHEKWVGGWINREYIRPEPKGVVLIIAPWNFPFSMCFQPLVAAIAAGNMVVIKPSEINPTCAPLIESLLTKYLDNECVKVVQGAVPETTALLNQRWNHIFYTGNGAIGRVVMAAAAKHPTPATLELGGKSPVIVDETAQMDAVCDRIAMAKWLNCGQVCVAPDYVLVHESRAQEFVERSKEIVKQSYGANPKESEDWGRIVNERHVDRIKKLIETSGGQVVCGGVQDIDRTDKYVPPTIIMQPKMEAPVMQEEIFGPVLAVVAYKELDEALDIVAGKETPLAMYMYSESRANIAKVVSSVNSGGLCVNSSLEHILGHNIPFGGSGASGMGSYHGKFGFDEFTHRRAVLYKTTLPMMRGPAIPLPRAGKPLPGFVYGLVVKMNMGFVPRHMRKKVRIATRTLGLAVLLLFVRKCLPGVAASVSFD